MTHCSPCLFVIAYDAALTLRFRLSSSGNDLSPTNEIQTKASDVNCFRLIEVNGPDETWLRHKQTTDGMSRSLLHKYIRITFENERYLRDCSLWPGATVKNVLNAKNIDLMMYVTRGETTKCHIYYQKWKIPFVAQ